ncbi:MAG: PD40 domain-containing protein [Flavobacteriales bacterium]|nr:PD40 domain-containing protein [Flavobacteriales bacterium]
MIKGYKYIMYICFAMVLALNSPNARAQDKMSKADKAVKKEADYYFSYTDYKSAIDLYKKLLERGYDSPELQYKMGVCILRTLSDREGASPYFFKAGEGNHEEAFFYLAQWYHLQEEFTKAKECYKRYALLKVNKRLHKEDMGHYIESCNFAENMIDYPKDVTIENMGDNINSEHSEYVPVISMDESTLIFTSRRPGSTGGKLDPLGIPYEDIYIAEQGEEKWGKPELIGSNINTDNHDASVGLSADGFTLITYKTNEAGTGGDLYWSLLDGEAWQEPTKFPEGINSEYQETSASYSSGMTEMYFSSNRPGGFGGIDIYSVKKLPNGEWGKVINLGPSINTIYNDDAPFIHPDNKTLFFSSAGHGTMGGYDIFKSTLKDDGTWEMADNLGYPINTTDDDIYFVLSADGKRGYLSSGRKGGYGEQDLYLVHLTDEVGKLTVVKGVLRIAEDDTTLVPFGAVITIIDAETQSLQGVYRSNSSTGKYLICVPPGKKYKMEVVIQGYEPFIRDWYFDYDAGFKIIHRPIDITSRIEDNPK